MAYALFSSGFFLCLRQHPLKKGQFAKDPDVMSRKIAHDAIGQEQCDQNDESRREDWMEFRHNEVGQLKDPEQEESPQIGPVKAPAPPNIAMRTGKMTQLRLKAPPVWM